MTTAIHYFCCCYYYYDEQEDGRRLCLLLAVLRYARVAVARRLTSIEPKFVEHFFLFAFLILLLHALNFLFFFFDLPLISFLLM